jgi:cytochrome c nitrite reductase small subunit
VWRWPAWIFSIAALTGVLAGAGGYTFVYAKGYSYLQDDPEACVNCHVMRPQFDAWRKSTHHAAAMCNDCHVPASFVGKWATKGRSGFWHSYYFTFQNFGEPIRITETNRAVLNANCVRCHEAAVAEIAPAHAPEAMNCVRCHDSVGHLR